MLEHVQGGGLGLVGGERPERGGERQVPQPALQPGEGARGAERLVQVGGQVPGGDPVQRLDHADGGQAVGDLVGQVGLGPAALLAGRLHLIGEQRQRGGVALTDR